MCRKEKKLELLVSSSNFYHYYSSLGGSPKEEFQGHSIENRRYLGDLGKMLLLH